MKKLLIVALMASTALMAAPAQNNNGAKLAQVKSKILNRLNEVEKTIEASKQCVNAAQSKQELQQCRKNARMKRKGMKEKMRAMKQQRKEMRGQQ